MNNIKAIELLTTATCPLKCKYCYIPKTDYAKELHKEIMDYLDSDELIKNIKYMSNGEMEYLGFWGTEPTLTLPIMTRRLNEIKKEIPTLKRVSFSTSLILNPKPIIDFIKVCNELKIDIEVQISVDGPKFIIDKNRMDGALDIIEKNLVTFINELNNLELDIKVGIPVKPTWSISNIIDINECKENLDEVVDYTNNWIPKFKSQITNTKVEFTSDKLFFTLVVPGKYTSDDGKAFAKLLKSLEERGISNSYNVRFERLIKFKDNTYNSRMFTCSGGDTNIGLDKNFTHLCHRTFYLNSDKYIDAVMSNPSIDNWDVSVFNMGFLNLIKDRYIVDMYDELEFTRWRYVNRGYHDFQSLFINNICLLTKELALSGQVDTNFLYDESYLVLFAYFIRTCLNCPMEQILNCGSQHLVPLSILRMFGNGAFRIILDKEIRDELSRRK